MTAAPPPYPESGKTLLLLRHAKAEQPGGVADMQRSLTERGHADAGAAGAWLAASGYRPDLVICSPARRTRQTWHGVAVALAGAAPPEVRYAPALYQADVPQVVGLIRRVPAQVRTVLLIGHNPTVSLLSVALDPDGLTDSDGLRTSGIAVHEVPDGWAALAPGTAPLRATYTARA